MCNNGCPLAKLDSEDDGVAVLFSVGEDIWRRCLLGGTITFVLPGTIPLISSTIHGNCGGVGVTLLRFGRPGQFVSIRGSDIGTVGGLTVFSVVDFPVKLVVGGIGGVKFLETHLMIFGDERTLPDIIDAPVIAFIVVPLVLEVVAVVQAVWVLFSRETFP